jgi:hypothetical protein
VRGRARLGNLRPQGGRWKCPELLPLALSLSLSINGDDVVMTKATGAALERIAARIRSEVDRRGLLLVHDAELPSVTALVAGEPVRGSWWSHPLAHDMYNAMELVDDDIASVKLVRGKVTYVAPRLWADLVSIGASRDMWQIAGLAADAIALLDRCNAMGDRSEVSKADRAAVDTLEKRLLVVGGSRHTAAGHHVRVVESWQHWAAVRSVAPTADVGDAIDSLRATAAGWPPARGRLFPWPDR